MSWMAISTLLAISATLVLAIWILEAAGRRRDGFFAAEPPLSLTHVTSRASPGPLPLLGGDSVPGMLAAWSARSGTLSIRLVREVESQSPHVAMGDAVDLVVSPKETAPRMVVPEMGTASRRHLLLYAILPKGAPAPRDADEDGTLTLASLIASRKRIRFLVRGAASERAEVYRRLLDAAWSTAAAPRGVQRTLGDSGDQATIEYGDDLVSPDESSVHVILVLWANAAEAPAKLEEALEPAACEPRFVTYFDPRVADTSRAMRSVAPFLRPDRVLLRGADDVVRTVTVAYSPSILLAFHEDRMTPEHVRMLDSVTREAFGRSDDPARLAAECAYLQLAAEFEPREALLSQMRAAGRALNFEPVPLVHHREGFEVRESPPPPADLVPVRAVTASGRLTFPSAFRDSKRSVRHLELSASVIDGVTLRVNDRVTLQRQADHRENGSYVVVSVDPETGRPLLESPRIVRDAEVLEKRIEAPQDAAASGPIWRLSGRVPEDLDGVLRAGDPVVWVTPGGEKLRDVTLTRVRGRLVEASLPARPSAMSASSWMHPLSRCSSDPEIPTMQLCVASWDVADPREHGPSVARAVWDRPCEHDVDCPFFDEATGSHGCQGGGGCSMPVGVRRVGFRGYDRMPTLKKNVP